MRLVRFRAWVVLVRVMVVKRVKFNYSGCIDKVLKAHDGQVVTVLRALTDDEADRYSVGPMSKIRFEDGFECDAFDDELDCVY